ncbi:MAG: GntR family transcriptional regulator [Acidobacteriia bacterium]|nr:GntR family transcriptional regulator [Terriglobia bacterium]
MGALLKVDLNSPVPVYQQIVDSLRSLLVTETLRAGALLPPVRQLALDLGIHFNTVAQAYRILAEEGWLDLRRRRGALILDRQTPIVQNEAKLDQLRLRIHQIASQLQAEGLSAHDVAAELRLLAKGMDK